MKTRKLIHSLAASAIAVTFASGAFAMDELGTPAQGARADRVINLGAGSKYVNVHRGEIATIVKDGKSFTWMFDTLGTPSFGLAAIAPPDFGADQVRVYVSPSPGDLSGGDNE